MNLVKGQKLVVKSVKELMEDPNVKLVKYGYKHLKSPYILNHVMMKVFENKCIEIPFSMTNVDKFEYGYWTWDSWMFSLNNETPQRTLDIE